MTLRAVLPHKLSGGGSGISPRLHHARDGTVWRASLAHSESNPAQAQGSCDSQVRGPVRVRLIRLCLDRDRRAEARVPGHPGKEGADEERNPEDRGIAEQVEQKPDGSLPPSRVCSRPGSRSDSPEIGKHKMLDEIIKDLTDDTKPIHSILLRLKVLLADIDQPYLVQFVNHELNGYPPGVDLPEYRIVRGQIRGHVASMAWRMSDHQLPTFHLSDAERQLFERVEIRESLAVIAEMLTPKGKILAQSIPIEFNKRLGEALQHGVIIDTAWTSINPASMVNIDAQVRSRILDFLLEIRSVVGKGATDEQIKEKVEGADIKAAFRGAIFGDNTTINFGHNSDFIAANTAVKSVDQLYQQLEQVGLPKAEITELGQAIKRDGGKPNLGGETGKWYENLLGKIRQGIVKVGMDVATTTIIDLLTKVAGIK